jgi:hypothetical protein
MPCEAKLVCFFYDRCGEPGALFVNVAITNFDQRVHPD